MNDAPLRVPFRRIDVHAHLNFAAYDADRDEVVRRALGSGTAFINVGTQKDTSRFSVDLAQKYDKGVYAIVGLHPIHTSASFHDKEELGEGGREFTSRGETFDPAVYRQFLKEPKVVGIGECGLDYYRLEPDKTEKQKAAFIAQIELANEFKKPLMFHIRDAYKDALEILKAHSKVAGNVHFFAGTVAEAKAFLDLGYTLSFTGVITFARQYEELVEFVPLDMIQAETDCPFAAPVPYRGKRCEPAHVSEVIDKIARIKKLPVDNVEKALLANARRVWDIDL